MKIYHKRNFLSGIFSVLLAITLTTLNIVQEEFRIKSFILAILCLFFGILVIISSMSREMTKKDIINERDERNQLVNLKSRSKSFVLTREISFILMLILFAVAKLSDNNMFYYISLGFASSFTISLITEICTTIYYEHRY